MTDISKYIEDSVAEFEEKVAEQEDEFLDFFMNDYLGDFFVDDTTLKDSSGNFDKINEINKKFDDAYDLFIIPFLLWLGKKLIDGINMQVDYFNSIGAKTSAKDVAWMARQLGISGNTIIKNSYLWNLGKMGSIRQQFQDFVTKSVFSASKFNIFLRNAKPFFKSTGKTRSVLAKYYMKYAYDAVAQTINTASLYLANKHGLDTFVYDGGIIKDTRMFCRERAGGVYTRKDAEEWNTMHWNGKIEGVDVLIACGGYNCLHNIKWINNTKDNGKEEEV